MKAIYVPISGFPEILHHDVDTLKYIVFEDNDTQIMSLDYYTNFFAYSGVRYLSSPINKLATFFKRLYSTDYSMNNVVRGPILLAGSLQGDPNVIDTSFPPHFLEELFRYYHIDLYEHRQD